MQHHIKKSERGSNRSKSIDKLHFTNYEYQIWTLKYLYEECHALTNRKRKSQIRRGKKFKKCARSIAWSGRIGLQSPIISGNNHVFPCLAKITFDKSDHSPIRTSPIYGYVKITIFRWENWNILSHSVAFWDGIRFKLRGRNFLFKDLKKIEYQY